MCNTRGRFVWTCVCAHASAASRSNISGAPLGGGIFFFFYVNGCWCNDVTVIQQHCSPDLQFFIIYCKPFISPREFASFILVGVYIPPLADAHDAQRILADQILCAERSGVTRTLHLLFLVTLTRGVH